MVTASYSLSQVHGAELWLLFWITCAVIYVGICLAAKKNRTKRGVRAILIGLLIAEVIADLIWAVIYYRNGAYINYGIGAVYGLIVWIPVLIVTGFIVTEKNGKSSP